MNVPRIKGSHNAMMSGMMAAEAAFAALAQGASRRHARSLSRSRAGELGSAKELKRVRNVKPLWSRFGTRLGVALGGIDMWTQHFGFSFLGTR